MSIPFASPMWLFPSAFSFLSVLGLPCGLQASLVVAQGFSCSRACGTLVL